MGLQMSYKLQKLSSLYKRIVLKMLPILLHQQLKKNQKQTLLGKKYVIKVLISVIASVNKELGTAQCAQRLQRS